MIAETATKIQEKDLTTFQHYIGYLSHYIYTFIVRTEEKRRDRIRIQRDMEFHHTLVLLRARSTAQIHGIAILRPIRRTMISTMDIYNEKMNDMWEPAPGIKLSRLKGETCNRSTTRAPSTNIDIFKANPSDEHEL